MFVPDKTTAYFCRNLKKQEPMKDISKISFEPTSVYFGYDYTLTEEGQAMLPPDIKPIGEGEKSWVFSGWDFLPFLFSHPKMAKQIVSYTTPAEYCTYFSVEERDFLEEYIPSCTYTDNIADFYITALLECFLNSLKFEKKKRFWVEALLNKMQEWGILDRFYFFTECNPLTGQKWYGYEKGIIMETFCYKIGKTQTEWDAIGWMLIGKEKEEWDEKDKNKLKSIQAGTRKIRTTKKEKTYLNLDRKQQESIIELCKRIENFDTSLGQKTIFTANSSKRNCLN